jgi:hypothetical protein
VSNLVRLGKQGSTAASTDFVSARVDVGSGPHRRHLWVDGNQKVSGWVPTPNAFSLPEIRTCPYRTPSCEAACYVHACYVHGLRKHRPDIAELYEHNERVIKEILEAGRLWSAALDFAVWVEEHCQESGFRWHVSGDIFSRQYAEEWVARVVEYTDGVRFWIYTRSFPHLEPLLAVRDYLAINLSADRDNYWLARRAADEHGLRVCYLTSDGTVPGDLREGDVVFPDYGLRERDLAPAEARGESTWYQSLGQVARAGVCPVDFYSKSEQRRCSLPGKGGCSKCLT